MNMDHFYDSFHFRMIGFVSNLRENLSEVCGHAHPHPCAEAQARTSAGASGKTRWKVNVIETTEKARVG